MRARSSIGWVKRPRLESLKSKAHLITDARKRKNLTHLQRVLLFKDSSTVWTGMKILLCSYRFAPDIGGVETVGAILAEQFAGLGHKVRVVTGSAGNDNGSDEGYQIIRRPGGRELVGLFRWSDVVL